MFNKRKYIIIPILFIIFCFTSCFGGSLSAPEKAAVKYLEAYFEKEIDDLIDLISDEYLNSLMYYSESNTVEIYKEVLDNTLTDMKGDYSIEIIDTYEFAPEVHDRNRYIDSDYLLGRDTTIIYADVHIKEKKLFKDNEYTKTFEIYVVEDEGEYIIGYVHEHTFLFG